MAAPVLPQQNVIDLAIGYFAPRLAAKRMAARGMMALAGGYTGARVDTSRLANWLPVGGSPTSDVSGDLPMLRARSADQERNHPVATGAVNTTVGHVIGTGLSAAPSIDFSWLGMTLEAAEEWQDSTATRWRAWFESVDCDIARNQNGYGQQSLAFRSMLGRGDCFTLTPQIERAGNQRMLVLQLVEADRVCNKDNKPNTATVIDGIEIDSDTGEAVKVHVAKFHPGDAAAKQEWTEREVRDTTGRRNVIHLFEQLRPGQVRGVPMLAPVLEPLKQLGRYTDAELNAAVVSALFAIFFKMDPDAFADMTDGDQAAYWNVAAGWSRELEGGQAVNLLPGEDVIAHNPARPNSQFDPFVQSILRQIGMALELPYEVLVMHFQSSYSAARGALLMAWRMFRRRRDFMATYWCQPIYELWLSIEVAEGRIAAPGFFADDMVRAAWSGCAWIGDGPGSIDPVKEVAAAEKRVALEISTLEDESVLHDGVPWKSKHARRTRELAAQRKDKTLMAQPGAPAPPPAGKPADEEE